MAKWQPEETVLSQAFNKMLVKQTRQALGIDPPDPPPTEAQKRDRRIADLRRWIDEAEQERATAEYSIEAYTKELAELESEA